MISSVVDVKFIVTPLTPSVVDVKFIVTPLTPSVMDAEFMTPWMSLMGATTGEKDSWRTGEPGGEMMEPRRVRVSSLTTPHPRPLPALEVIHPPASRMRS